MNEMFKKEDIKADYLLEISNGAEKFLASVCYDKYDDLVVSGDCFAFDFDDFDDVLNYGTHKVTKIYGRLHRLASHESKTYYRALLWERKEPKKMTLKEVSEELGYEVEIVNE